MYVVEIANWKGRDRQQPVDPNFDVESLNARYRSIAFPFLFFFFCKGGVDYYMFRLKTFFAIFFKSFSSSGIYSEFFQNSF